MKDEAKSREDLPYGGKPIIPNEERRKYGLAPIPGGDVEIISIHGFIIKEGRQKHNGRSSSQIEGR